MKRVRWEDSINLWFICVRAQFPVYHNLAKPHKIMQKSIFFIVQLNQFSPRYTIQTMKPFFLDNLKSTWLNYPSLCSIKRDHRLEIPKILYKKSNWKTMPCKDQLLNTNEYKIKYITQSWTEQDLNKLCILYILKI